MSFTKKLRKELLREGAVPGKDLEFSIRQTRGRMRGCTEHPNSELRYRRQAMARHIETAEHATFACHRLLAHGFMHTLPCNNYPRDMAVKLLPANRRRVSPHVRPSLGPRSRIYERGHIRYRRGPDELKWVRSIISCFAIMSPTRLYVKVDKPGGMVTMLLHAPRGWRWKMLMENQLNDMAWTTTENHNRYVQYVVLQSNSAKTRHAVLTARQVISGENPGVIVRELMVNARAYHDAYARAERNRRTAEADSKKREQEYRRRQRTMRTVAVYVYVAGRRKKVEASWLRGQYDVYVSPG